MTTSNEWEPRPTTPPTTSAPAPVTTQYETTPIADEVAAAADSGAREDASTNDRAEGAASTAKEQGAQVADTAKEQGSAVASTAAEEVKQVAGEAKAKATDLLSDAQAQVTEQSKAQLQGVASKLGELGDELDALLSGDGATDGTVTDLARQLSERTRSLSDHLAEREPADLIKDVRSFARRRPGTFLLGAAAAGLVAGRLTRGAQKAKSDGTSPSTTTQTSGSTTSAHAAHGADEHQAATAVTAVAEVPVGQNTGGRQ